MPLSPGDYDRALSEYVGRVSRTPGLLAVFQFGEASHPGISDLDMLIVVEDDISGSSLRGLVAATRADSVSAYLFPHEPMVIPRSIAAHAGYIHTLFNLRQAWGTPLEIGGPGDGDVVYLRLAEYVDFTFGVRTVLRSMAQAGGSFRWLLLLLKSCVHSLRLASAVAGRPLGMRLVDRVTRLREDSLADQHKALRAAPAVLEECLGELGQADRILEHSLVGRGVVARSRLRECICHADGRYYLFETPYDAPATTDDGDPRSLRGFWKLVEVDPSVEACPGFYLAQFATYGTGSGEYARAHRLVFGIRAAQLILAPTYRAVLETRLRIAQRVYDVVGRGGLVPMVPLGIGMRSPAKIRASWRRRLLRGIVATRALAGRP
jgi:hypothetical protein